MYKCIELFFSTLNYIYMYTSNSNTFFPLLQLLNAQLLFLVRTLFLLFLIFLSSIFFVFFLVFLLFVIIIISIARLWVLKRLNCPVNSLTFFLYQQTFSWCQWIIGLLGFSTISTQCFFSSFFLFLPRVTCN